MKIDEIGARCGAATPAPWNEIRRKGDRLYLGTIKKPIADVCNLYGEESEANLEFISHAREDIPALLEHIEQLQTENSKLKSRLEKSVELPCKVGDTIFTARYNEVNPFKVSLIFNMQNKWHIQSGSAEFYIEEFGKTVFYTREEAERAVKEGSEKS